MHPLLYKLQLGERLDFSQARQLQSEILNGSILTDVLLDILRAFNRTLTPDEFAGLFAASEEAMIPVAAKVQALDTCGTGGDGHNTFNISTAAAIICAGAGVAVAKHGNRSASSLCGSADVLEALGVDINLSPFLAAQYLQPGAMVFLFARSFNPAFKHAAEARKQFNKPTYFNFLGPLLNPAHAPSRLLGVADPSMIEIMGQTLIQSGVKRAWLFHSQDELDEISTAGPTTIYDFSASRAPKVFLLDPQAYDLPAYAIADLAGGTAETNAEIIRSIMKNRATDAQKTAAILNAAAGLVVAGKAQNFGQGLELAEKSLQSGAANKALQTLINIGK